MLIGSVQPFSSKKMLVSSVENAIKDRETTLMIYTGAPQNSKRSPLDFSMIKKGRKLMEEHGLSQLVVHAPYIINLANCKNQKVFDFSVDFLKKEVYRAEAMGATQIVLHPGSHVGVGTSAGIDSIIKGLNEVISPTQKIEFALETMAGKGSEIGKTFEELAEIINNVEQKDKLSVTFDTCHTNDAGYNIKNDFDQVLVEFDQVIGLERLKVLHLNDSKNSIGSHSDRHENIGFGTIGFDSLNYIAHHPKLTKIPKILETPNIEGKSSYKFEVDMLRKETFDPKLLEKIRNEV